MGFGRQLQPYGFNYFQSHSALNLTIIEGYIKKKNYLKS